MKTGGYSSNYVMIAWKNWLQEDLQNCPENLETTDGLLYQNLSAVR